MGVDLGNLVVKKRVELSDLAGKVVAVDAFNAIYQFLSIIRQRDGTPLLDAQGRITSHLSGLFYRNINLLEQDIRLIYVFDGPPPVWKTGTIESRRGVKEDARRKWEDALKEGRLDDARKFAQATSSLTPEMVEECKELLGAMGIPYVQARSEGEAEAAYLVTRGKADYAASQDYDALLFGSPVLLRNLTMSGKRRLPGRGRLVDVFPEVISLQETLDTLGITRQQLIWVGLLIGTDFNEGVKNIGPKKGLKLVKECSSLKEVHTKSNAQEELSLWESIEEFFLRPDVDDVVVGFGNIDKQRVMKIMCETHGFSPERIGHSIDTYVKAHDEKAGQSRIGKWL
ncbi:MAG: flap endonuclease-1 [Candidatus Micrarchaeota archaeon]|nr:flap endonuclease-1 [Candidatus Micrarchaeota archaeon]